MAIQAWSVAARGTWRRRAIRLEPWLIGLAGFLVASAALLLREEGAGLARLAALALPA
ncbi:MAG TPA: hypothetical protein VM265_06640 [Sphingomicrobium sp.]|nr:hypothetical protein [Sphingomicrobium sp.]